jgi:carbon monoxide dehydrogenase subunit G
VYPAEAYLVQITGEFDTRKDRRQVYLRLIDPAWLVEALDFPAPAIASNDECVVKGEVGFGPLRGAIEIHVRVADRKDRERAAYTGWGEGLGSRLTLKASFELSDNADGGTHVAWEGQADITGPVGPVADTAFHPLSRHNFEHLRHALDDDHLSP